jgi:addiction module RelE/StbE family toxin
MIIILHKKFVRKFKKLRESEKVKFRQRRDIFLCNQFDPILYNHILHGEYLGFRSINVGGDLRVIYTMIERNTALFVDIDTHSNLYS